MPTDAERIKELEEKVKSLERSNLFLQKKVDDFENGADNLYHAVNRKMTELSRILNKHKLDDIDIDDKNSKTFERISSILEKCEKYALSANALGAKLGIDIEKSDTEKPIYRKPTTPESIADSVGELAGQKT